MHLLFLVSQLAAICAGLISAYFWWASSGVKFESVPELPTLADGAIALQVDTGILLWDLPKQGRLNAIAAVWTGAAVLLQAFGAALQMIGAQPHL